MWNCFKECFASHFPALGWFAIALVVSCVIAAIGLTTGSGGTATPLSGALVLKCLAAVGVSTMGMGILRCLWRCL